MKNEIIYQPFNAATVALQGSNLIEASAGTGKTYSIALLALRLVIEDNVPVEKILMVTFTKAAVAELQERVRKFIRLAYDVAREIDIEDKTITQLVNEQCEKQGRDAIEERLKDAVLLLDELSIMTIHGFCQQTLTEFAFETGQLFGAEMFTDIDLIVEQELNAFWRSHITTMDVSLLSLLGYDGLRQEIRNIVKQQLDGKQYEGFNTEAIYSLNDISVAAFDKLQQQVAAESKQREALLLKTFEQYAQEIEVVCDASRAKNKKEFIACLGNASDFVELLNSVKPNVLTAALPQGFMSVYTDTRAFIEQAEELIQLRFKKQLYYFAIQQIGGATRDFLLRNNLLGYNDLIKNLHKALIAAPNPALVAAMQAKYAAVFVDEFQDTDREQYQIFATAFPAPTLMFLIGDPKQSIYAWRKADIFTYFAARAAVDNRYSMNVNYRSAAPVITAMNSFFQPHPDFDAFAFSGNEDSIKYMPVESPGANDKGCLMYGGEAVVPMSIFEAAKKEEIHLGVARQIQALLTDGQYKIVSDKCNRTIRPSDIGILVRKNDEAVGVKNYLARLGIPAVTINDSKILETTQALELLYLLEAIWEPAVAAINRALLTSFCGFTTDEVLRLNQEAVLSLFQQYKETWTNDGVYPALTKFVKEFNVRERLQQQQHAFGERIIANLYQLIELLNQAQQRRELSPEELISWLKRGVNGMNTEGDEFQTRMESDEEAVKIITIHKSKGLEYNIVFAPYLDMNAESKHTMMNFRHPANGDYVAKERKLMSAEEQQWNREQLEQENRRLIYVAVTRAVYKCFIYKNSWSGNRNSGLSAFLDALNDVNANRDGIEFGSIPQLDVKPYRTESEAVQTDGLVAHNFKLAEENWRKLSYTGISAHGIAQPKERAQSFEDAYDEFVFSKLRFGAATGNLLHQLLEDIDFTQQDRWDDVILKTVKAYLPAASEAYAQLIRQLLQHIVTAEIKLGYDTFSLSDVPFYKRISELEFDFPLQNFRAEYLSNLGGDGKDIFSKSFEGKGLEGIMNGKIDLFFEHNGRFYVLDWKSNYLGYKPEDYNKDGLLNGMNENNYHLQYLIYTVAVKKYLESRLLAFDYEKQFGGVVYLFMRGLRQGSDYGIFTARPSLKKIEALEQILYKKTQLV